MVHANPGSARLSLVIGLSVWFVQGCGGGGNIDCAAYVDRQYECGLLPADTRDQLRDTNVQICENWDATYKAEVTTALDSCTDLPCDEIQSCASAANQLCQADVTAEKERVCTKVVECGWEGLTTMEICRDELRSVELLYMCLDPDVLEDYVRCIEDAACGEDEANWYICGDRHIY